MREGSLFVFRIEKQLMAFPADILARGATETCEPHVFTDEQEAIHRTVGTELEALANRLAHCNEIKVASVNPIKTRTGRPRRRVSSPAGTTVETPCGLRGARCEHTSRITGSS